MITQPDLFASTLQPVTQEGFDVYDTENPAIYAKLADFAIEAHRAGATHIGIGMLYERLRWYTKVEARDDTFKVNNNYRAFYARKLMRDFPALAGIFETRTSKADV